MRAAIMVVLLWLPGTPALADPWTLMDLGRVHKERHCLAAAKQTFRDLLGEVRIGRLRSSAWVVYADGINGAHDALISCTFGDNRGTRATLVIHSTGRPVDARLLGRRIGHLYGRNARRITRAWIDSYD